MSLALNIFLIVALGLAGSFALAVAIGKAIKLGHGDTDRFRRDLPNPNRDNYRDDLGGNR